MRCFNLPYDNRVSTLFQLIEYSIEAKVIMFPPAIPERHSRLSPPQGSFSRQRSTQSVADTLSSATGLLSTQINYVCSLFLLLLLLFFLNIMLATLDYEFLSSRKLTII